MTISTPVELAPGLNLPTPYLLFLGDVREAGFAKTAFGLKDWAGELCLGEWALEGAAVSTGLPFMDPARAVAAGARALVIGVANIGGVVPVAWVGALVSALDAGLDLVSGMHAPLDAIPELKAAAARQDRRLIDIRRPPADIPIATGAQADRPAAPHGWYGLRARQEVHRAGARSRPSGARRRCAVPGHRSDGHTDRGRRLADGRGSRRLRGGRRRDAKP